MDNPVLLTYVIPLSMILIGIFSKIITKGFLNEAEFKNHGKFVEYALVGQSIIIVGIDTLVSSYNIRDFFQNNYQMFIAIYLIIFFIILFTFIILKPDGFENANIIINLLYRVYPAILYGSFIIISMYGGKKLT